MMKRLALVPLAAVGILCSAYASHYDGGRVPPVHRFSLTDECGETIVANAENPMPPSMEQTCGACHDYAKITSGFHFSPTAGGAAGRIAQPWFWIDAVNGSQIPLGVRGFPGIWKPEQLGLSNWEYVRLFARNMPGGDVAAPEELFGADEPNRWPISGRLEANCFACHSTGRYDFSEYVRQTMRQNWRWASATAFGLGDTIGMGERAPTTWIPLDGENPDDKLFAVPPQMRYHTQLFDDKNRAFLDVGRPKDSNCLNCHGTAAVGAKKENVDADIHSRAGMLCADCHRNGEDHDIARGSLATSADAANRTKVTSTCAGCHVGDGKEGAGRLGAPRPKHIGMPLVHFDKLSCTTCHSGVTPNGELGTIRTARANRMGIYGRATWVTDAPYIQEPVFMRNAAGQIEPRRVMWPAFWGTRDAAGKITPIRPDSLSVALTNKLNVAQLAGLALTAVAANPNLPGEPVIIKGDVIYKRNYDKLAEQCGTATAWQDTLCANDPDGGRDISTNRIVNRPTEDVYVARLLTNGTITIALPQFDTAQEIPGNATLDYTDQLTALGASDLANGRQAAVVYKNKMFVLEETKTVDDETGYITYPIQFTTKDSPVASELPQMGWLVDGKFQPLLDAYVTEELAALSGTTATLTENLVKRGLGLLKQHDASKQYVYVAHGQVFTLDGDTLTASKAPEAEPVSWAVAHDVRPARMARGAAPAKCADCHTVGSSFFFGKVTSTGPLLTARPLVRTQADYMGITDEVYHRIFGVTFLMRPFFKAFLWTASALGTLALLAFLLVCLPAMLNRSAVTADSGKLFKTADSLTGIVFVLAVAYLAFSGFFGWVAHGMTHWVIIGHMVAGGAFGAAVLALIAFRAVRQEKCCCTKTMFWILIAIGVGLMLTAVAPMMTWLGSTGQLWMLQAHRCLAGCCVVVLLLVIRSLLKKN